MVHIIERPDNPELSFKMLQELIEEHNIICAEAERKRTEILQMPEKPPTADIVRPTTLVVPPGLKRKQPFSAETQNLKTSVENISQPSSMECVGHLTIELLEDRKTIRLRGSDIISGFILYSSILDKCTSQKIRISAGEDEEGRRYIDLLNHQYPEFRKQFKTALTYFRHQRAIGVELEEEKPAVPKRTHRGADYSGKKDGGRE